MQMIESEIRDSIRGFLKENFLYMRPDFVLGDDDLLLEKGVIDSMGVLEMMTFIEDTHGVKLEDHEVSEANLGSLNAVARFVASKRRSIAA
jgi:acyl carrier protein